VFSHWHGLPHLDGEDKNVFSTGDFMGRFFKYEYSNTDFFIEQPIVYVSNYKAIAGSSSTNNSQNLIDQLKQKRVWVAGTKTWLELAKKGIWVEGSADALGLESLRQVFSIPLLNISINDVCVITNKQSEQTWQEKGWHVTATYSLLEKESEELKAFFRNADIIFWTSYRQCQQYKSVLKENVVHCCPAGETAELLRVAGIVPIVFPTIKSFQQWRKSSIPSRSAA